MRDYIEVVKCDMCGSTNNTNLINIASQVYDICDSCLPKLYNVLDFLNTSTPMLIIYFHVNHRNTCHYEKGGQCTCGVVCNGKKDN